MSRSPWALLAAVLSVVFVIGMTVAVLFDRWSTSPDDLQATISKAGVTTAVITVAGALANGAIRLLDERRTRDQERRRVFHDVVDAYNEVKATRRAVKALGLFDADRAELTADEAKDLRSIMARLIDAQLRFEAIRREVAQSDLFRDKEGVLRQLGCAEDYINKSVVENWERHGGKVWTGAPPTVIESLGLQPFIADGFKRHISDPLDILTDLMQRELFDRRH
jgi:hypothetical protein